MRNRPSWIVAALLVVTLAGASVADAAAAKKYQVTGTVIAITDDVITVQKPDGDKWELNRDPKAKVAPKVGDKVTIQYTMTVASVDVKPAK